jgi:hypothetical protein
MRNLILILITVLMLPLSMFADSVTLKDAKVYNGAIISSDIDFINVLVNDTTTVRIPHGLVQSVFFRYADMVYLLTGEDIKCKILEEKFPDMRLVTPEGLKVIKLVDLKRYFYSSSDSLVISSLPVTGALFNNQKSIARVEKPFRQSLSLSISGGIIYPTAEEWQQNFITSSSVVGAMIQGQIGLTLIEDLSVFGGYTVVEYDNTTEGDLNSAIKTTYYHLGVEYSYTFDSLPFVDFLAGVDGGLIKISGNLYSYSYREVRLEDLSPNIAFRPILGIRTFIIERLGIYLKAAYLITQEQSVPIPEVENTAINIPLNGLTVFAGINFNVPLNLW